MQLLISSVCMALTSAVIGNAYYQKKQFYPAVVYITKSNASMAVIYIQFFVIVFMFGKLLRKIFLGTLRAAEFEHLLERFWYALTETCLAFTVFRDDFNPRFVALFTVLLFLKSFHWLAEERVDFMERSPVLGWLFHIRVASLLSMLGILDYVLLMHAYNSTLVRGPTVQLVFGFEYAILLTVIASTAIKYVLHAAEMRTDTPWENKAVFLLYTELVIGLIKVVLYVLFVVIMAKIYALPMFVFRPMFFTIRNFRKALNDVIMSRRAIRNMNTLYPDATAEELRQSDNICIICREDMVNHAKKLPCGHIFHTTCLRSWFQRQQTCPTCRLNILRTPPANSTALPRVGGGAAAAGANAADEAANGGAPAGAPAAAAAAPGVNAGNLPTAEATAAAAAATIGGVATVAMPSLPGFTTGSLSMPSVMPQLAPFMMPPPWACFSPPTVPLPPMPQDLTNLSDDELRAMEGNERKHIEERLQLLRNITLMLDSAGLLMQQYQALTMRLRIEPTNTQVSSASATTTTSAAAAATYDKPSTSTAAAAAAAAFAARAEEALQIKTPAPAPTKTSTTTATTATTTAAAAMVDKVTIEDLGAEDDEVVPTSATTATTTTTASTEIINSPGDCNNFECEDSAELTELRKRRLKFLEERNKTSPTPTTTTSTSTGSDANNAAE